MWLATTRKASELVPVSSALLVLRLRNMKNWPEGRALSPRPERWNGRSLKLCRPSAIFPA